jgi:hypothetical protein
MLEAMARIAPSQPNKAMARIAPRRNGTILLDTTPLKKTRIAALVSFNGYR